MGVEVGIHIETEGDYDVENTIFVAVGKNVKESKSILLWAAKSFSGKKICLLHVHQPTLMDGSLSASKLKQQAVKDCREMERQRMQRLLNQYFLCLSQMEVQAGKMCIEMDNIEKAIVQTISQYGIRWLVMGAAAEKHYSEKMSELKSNKAIFVGQKTPLSCHIWFVCKGCLVYTRSANISFHVGGLSSPTSTKRIPLPQNHAAEVNGDANTFQSLHHQFSSNQVLGTLRSNSELMYGKQEVSPLPSLHKSQALVLGSLSGTSLENKYQERATYGVRDKLEHAMIDAENSKQKAFKESVRRWKAEEDAMEAVQKAEALESLCIKALNHRKEMEEMLAMQRQEYDRIKNQYDQAVKELKMVQDHRPVLEGKIADSHLVKEELEEKIIQAAKLLITFKEQREKLQTEQEKAIKEIDRLRKLVGKGTVNVGRSSFFAFSFLEIVEATQSFDPCCKIGDGRTGSIYKGLLRHMKVAIKMLPSHGSQGDLEFEHEAGVLARVRHPNLVTLIGTCLESRSLIYEYLENGSLEDRLANGGKTPLPWQTRIKIVIEICSTLIFLHSSKPCIIHGNLKPSKVLLDANFVGKFGDLGICHLIRHDINALTTSYSKTDPEVSAYLDPKFIETGELTKACDIYSFGILLLRLLTGRPALGIVKYVKCALEWGNLNTDLDISAGDWPLEQAEQLARLALVCCEDKQEDRPDLVSDVWTVIEPMRDLCSSTCLDNEEHGRVPSHFVCPIFQEVMKDPYTAADGFTYEADAIKGWLDSGHKTSPMTNLKLQNCNVLPNHALYYAIQEWQHQS